MVNISALITDGQQILLFQNDKNEKNEYALPSVFAPTLVGAKRKLKKLINALGIQFFFNREIYNAFNNGDDNYAFLCHVTSYTSLPKNEDYIWIGINEFKDVALKDTEAHSSQAVLKYVRERLDVIDAVKAKIGFLNQHSGVNLSFSEKLNGVQIFIFAPGFICPFSYLFSFDFVNEEEVEFNVNWMLNRSVAPGDKSDIYIFFSETMGMLLKLFLQEPVVVAMFGHCFIDGEIGGARLLFESDQYNEIISRNEIVDRIAFLFEVFKIAMSLHGELIGSISHKNIAKNNDEILKSLEKENH